MSEQIAGKNKAVFFTYSVMDESGELLEQSDLPIGYVHGIDGDIIEKLEQGMHGHKAGDKLEVTLSPEEGFGVVDLSLIFEDKLKNVPSQFHKIGAEVEMRNEDGGTRKFLVTKIKKGKLIMDGNHPYAGKTITFNITITEIRDATQKERQAGRPEDSPPPQLH